MCVFFAIYLSLTLPISLTLSFDAFSANLTLLGLRFLKTSEAIK